jgi:hypothetical protein
LLFGGVLPCASPFLALEQTPSSVILQALKETQDQREGKNIMKTLISMFALTLVVAFAGPAFAGATEAKTQADCEKAGGVWDAATSKCAEKK